MYLPNKPYNKNININTKTVITQVCSKLCYIFDNVINNNVVIKC